MKNKDNNPVMDLFTSYHLKILKVKEYIEVLDRRIESGKQAEKQKEEWIEYLKELETWYITLPVSDEKDTKSDLTLQELRTANVKMTEECFPSSLKWTTEQWGLALVGEVGELCNFLKKRNRGEEVNQKSIDYEFADIMFYLDKWANKEDVDLEEVVREKYNIVAKKKGSDLKL